MSAHDLKGIDLGKVGANKDVDFTFKEFMDTFGDAPDWQLKNWRQRAIDCGMNIIYEHHPESGWLSLIHI